MHDQGEFSWYYEMIWVSVNTKMSLNWAELKQIVITVKQVEVEVRYVAPDQLFLLEFFLMCVCVCVCMRACVRVCVHEWGGGMNMINTWSGHMNL